MPRPNKDRIRWQMFIGRAAHERVKNLAASRGVTAAEMYRRLLKIGMEQEEREQ